MARASNQKQKILILRQYLERYTDEDHPAGIAQLIEELERQAVSAERKSIYSDLDALEQFGLDIQSRKGRSPGWFIGQRDFQLAELKLLVDAVQSSRFLTKRKSDSLIHKLEGLTSVYQAQQLQRQVYVDRRVKNMNESIYYTVDKLHSAIANGKRVSFRYFDYNVNKEKVYRQNGARYVVSPWGLVWNNENYYLIAFDSVHRDMRHYRVDKMDDLTITRSPREKDDDGEFDIAAYAEKHFSMFTGTEATVRLRCESRMVSVVLDRFGMDTILVPDGPDYFTVTLSVVVSPQFYGWLFGLGNAVTLEAPDWAVSEYRARLLSAAGQYPAPDGEPPDPE